MDRRGFMQAILAAGIAPYVSTAAGVLMPVRQRAIWLWGDGIHDDTEALQAILNGIAVKNVGPTTVQMMDGRLSISTGKFLITSSLVLPSHTTIADSFFYGKQTGALFEVQHSETKEIVLNSNVMITA